MKLWLLILLLSVLISGCGFAQHKIVHPDGTKESFVVWTAFKEIHWGQYYSENDKVDILMPWGIFKSGEK